MFQFYKTFAQSKTKILSKLFDFVRFIVTVSRRESIDPLLNETFENVVISPYF